MLHCFGILLIMAAAVTAVNQSSSIHMPALSWFYCCAAECSFLTTGQAVIADVFPPAVRGTMMGVHMLAVVSDPNQQR